jgi:hypothetical protein
MAGIKGLVGRKMTKVTKFMGEDVNISKLNVSNVMEIQEKVKKLDENDNEGFDLLRLIIRAAVEGGDELSDEDFEGFPLDELSKISNEIMKFSGVTPGAGENKTGK